MEIFYIGGSPCSGKSTVARALAEQHGLAYFYVDDYLDEFIDRGAAAGWPVCRHIRSMTDEETWMRPPQVQCSEELAFYAEIAPLAAEKLRGMAAEGIVAEGAAFLPELMKCAGIPKERYIAITPTREFQFSRYSQRPWVPHVLRACSDPAAAFANWMERDVLFAEAVRKQCGELGYASLVTDGNVSEAERLQQAERIFSLAK